MITVGSFTVLLAPLISWATRGWIRSADTIADQLDAIKTYDSDSYIATSSGVMQI